MMRQQFRLRLGGLRKLLCQDLSNPLVILLAGALEQGLVCRILNQGMFEQIGRLGRDTTLIQQFRLDELAQALLQGSVVSGGSSPEDLIAKLPSDDRPELCHRFDRG